MQSRTFRLRMSARNPCHSILAQSASPFTISTPHLRCGCVPLLQCFFDDRNNILMIVTILYVCALWLMVLHDFVPECRCVAHPSRLAVCCPYLLSCRSSISPFRVGMRKNPKPARDAAPQLTANAHSCQLRMLPVEPTPPGDFHRGRKQLLLPPSCLLLPASVGLSRFLYVAPITLSLPP